MSKKRQETLIKALKTLNENTDINFSRIDYYNCPYPYKARLELWKQGDNSNILAGQIFVFRTETYEQAILNHIHFLNENME